MRTTLKIQIILVISMFSLFGVIFTKTADATAPASYQKAGNYYLTEAAGKCQNGYLLDKYDAFVERCSGGAICTAIRDEDSGEMEVGCFVEKPAPIQPSVPQQSADPVVVRIPAGGSSSCSLTKEEYNQCGGTEGLEDKPKNHTFRIVRYVDCNGVVKKYEEPQDLEDHGQCVRYRMATSELALKTSPSYPYPQNGSGGVTVSVPSDIFSIDPTPGKKAIFVQFLDANNQPIMFGNNSDFAVEYIDLESTKPSEAIAATIETSPSVNGTNRTWQPTSIKVTLSGLNETNSSVAAVFIRSQTGECSVSACGFIGWTKIKTYGTNGSDQFSWTPNPGDLTEGVHMFGLFSLNADGTANKLLSVSPTNYLPK